MFYVALNTEQQVGLQILEQVLYPIDSTRVWMVKRAQQSVRSERDLQNLTSIDFFQFISKLTVIGVDYA